MCGDSLVVPEHDGTVRKLGLLKITLILLHCKRQIINKTSVFA